MPGGAFFGGNKGGPVGGGRGGKGLGKAQTPGGQSNGVDAEKFQRQREQKFLKDAKTNREIDFFWSVQAQNRQRDQERGGPPRKGRARLDQEEAELFGDVTGAVGIDFQRYDEIQVEMSGNGHDTIQVRNSFNELSQVYNLNPWLTENIQRCKYQRPTPVQRYGIPTAIRGFDFMCCAQTGSGKTCAFLIPLICNLSPNEGCENGHSSWEGPATPLALVLAPTRELCSQIFAEARKLLFRSNLKVSQCYGGVDAKPQLRDLSRGCDLIVATPGRLVDFIDREVIDMGKCRTLVLDEADRMLDMGFEPQIRQIVEQRGMPGKFDRHTMMFSATFPREIQVLAARFLRDYIWISVGRVGAAAETVTQEFIPVRSNMDKLPMLHQELLKSNPDEKVLVFVGMKRTASWLVRELQRSRIQATDIHGDLNQVDREKSLNLFKSGERPVMVATEVAARGLDIPKVAKVINYDMPGSIDDYIHRIGRTGRVGHRGNAMSFFMLEGSDEPDTNIAKDLHDVLEMAGMEIPPWLQSECQAKLGKDWQKQKKKTWSKFGSRDHRGGQGAATHRIRGDHYGSGKGSQAGAGGGGGGGGYGGPPRQSNQMGGMSGFNNGYEKMMWNDFQQGGGFNQGGSGFNQGFQHQQGGGFQHQQGGFNQGGGFQQGGFNQGGGFQQGGFNQGGGFSQGGGGFNQGSSMQQQYGGFGGF